MILYKYDNSDNEQPYVLYDSKLDKELYRTDKIALCYSGNYPHSILMKFGKPELVKKWYNVASAAYSSKFTESEQLGLNIKLHYVEGDFEVDEINNCIEICDYINQLLKRDYFNKTQINM